MEHEISDMEVGEDNLVQKPWKVFQKTEDLPRVGRADSLLMEEKIT
jgi:hypothetical protein